MERGLRALRSLAAVALVLLSAGHASAEEDPGMRLHAGGGLGGSVFIAPGYVTFGAAGSNVQVGVRFNDLLSLSLDFDGDNVFGKPPRLCLAGGPLVKFTFDRRISVGVGPHAGWYGEAGGFRDPTTPVTAANALYGGKVYFAWHFYRIFTLNFDVRLLRGQTALVVPMPMGPTTAPVSTAIIPRWMIGFETL